MKVTADGTVTIPEEFRAALGLEPDTEVVFERDGDALRLRRADPSAPASAGPPVEPGAPYPGKGAALVAQLREAGRRHWGGMSTEEVMRLTRGED